MSEKQKKAAKANIKKAQEKWKSMSSRQRALAQPEGRKRLKPGTGGKGKFFRITLRPKSEFVSFRNHDIGEKGHLERIAGKRSSGSWATQAWLVAKTDALIVNKTLVGKTSDVKDLLATLQTKPKQIKGDVFQAKDRKNIPEKSKPTPAMKKAQTKNIKKAIAARWKK